MGFHEDDRIRNKNRAANAAYAKYQEYKDKKLSDSDILQELEKTENSNYAVVHEIRKIVAAKSGQK